MKKVFILAVVLIVLAALSGCVSIDEKQIFERPAFNNSHAILIEKTISEIPIQSLLTDNIRSGERIVVAPVEDVVNDRTGLVPLIEDNLVFALAQNNFSVLERKDSILQRLEREKGSVYKAFAERDLPISPVLRLINELDVKGLNYLNFKELLPAVNSHTVVNGDEAMLTLESIDAAIYAEILEFYNTLDASYFEKQAIAATDVELETADVLVSYRVMECGIFMDTEKTEFEKDDQTIFAQLRLVYPEMLTNTKYTREANARMFIRIVDAKTGEIRGAKLIENINTDTIEYRQGEKETSREYSRRMRDYRDLLAAYHYTYYDQQFPLEREKQEQEVFEKSVVNDDKSEDGFFEKIGNFFSGEESADSTGAESADSSGEGFSLFGGAAESDSEAGLPSWFLPVAGVAGGVGLIAVIGMIALY